MDMPQHLIGLLHNLYCEQKATVQTEYGDTEWFSISKGVRKVCILSPYLFNWYTEHIIYKTELDSEEGRLKIGGRNINNLKYADDSILLAESRNDPKQLLMKLK